MRSQILRRKAGLRFRNVVVLHFVGAICFGVTNVAAQTSPSPSSTGGSAEATPSVAPSPPASTTADPVASAPVTQDAPAPTPMVPTVPQPTEMVQPSQTAVVPTEKRAPRIPVPPSPGPSIWGPVAEHKLPFFKKWYGWKTLLAVVPTDVLVIGSAFSGNSTFTSVSWAIGIPTHMLAGPINHWAHGYVGHGFVALAANVTLPAVGLMGGSDAAIAVLYCLGPLLDAAVSIVPDKVSVSNVQTAGWKPSSVTLVPMIDGQRRGLALMGQF